MLTLEIVLVDNLDNIPLDIHKRVKEHILAYLVGYVVRQLSFVLKTVKCPMCRLSLVNNSVDLLDEETQQLLKVKNKKLESRGLSFPSKSVHVLVTEAQKVFESEIVIPFIHNLNLPQYDLFETLTK